MEFVCYFPFTQNNLHTRFYFTPFVSFVWYRGLQQLTSFLLTLGETARFRQIYPNLEQFNSTAVLYAFDIAIWDYIVMNNGRLSGTSDSFAYISQLTAIRGNIKGDGIGLLIGVATSRTPLKK